MGFGPTGDLVLGDYIRWDFILGDLVLDPGICSIIVVYVPTVVNWCL